jgi:Ala-tRNA(Pro) deacylase
MQDVLALLQSLQIPYELHEHDAYFTAEDADETYKKIPGGHSKNLFLRNRSGNQHYLYILELTKRADLKALARQLGESQLGFASPERLLKHLGLTPGSVSPFGLINDKDHHVIALLDEGLLRHDRLNYHPNINTATVGLSREDFLKFLEWTGNEIRRIET